MWELDIFNYEEAKYLHLAIFPWKVFKMNPFL